MVQTPRCRLRLTYPLLLQHWVAQGDWHFNPACWPDPQGMFDELQRMGIELMVTFWPFQSTESRHWDEFTSNGYLANVINATKPTSYDGGNQYLVDQTNPATRKAVFNGFMEGYGTYGIKTIWIDAAEPEHNGASMVNFFHSSPIRTFARFAAPSTPSHIASFEHLR